MDEKLVEAIRSDFRTAPISVQDRVMLEYVETPTRDATRIGKEDHEKLRAVGFDDTGLPHGRIARPSALPLQWLLRVRLRMHCCERVDNVPLAWKATHGFLCGGSTMVSLRMPLWPAAARVAALAGAPVTAQSTDVALTG